mgnify:CR=1 FL=1
MGGEILPTVIPPLFSAYGQVYLHNLQLVRSATLRFLLAEKCFVLYRLALRLTPRNAGRDFAHSSTEHARTVPTFSIRMFSVRMYLCSALSAATCHHAFVTIERGYVAILTQVRLGVKQVVPLLRLCFEQCVIVILAPFLGYRSRIA